MLQSNRLIIPGIGLVRRVHGRLVKGQQRFLQAVQSEKSQPPIIPGRDILRVQGQGAIKSDQSFLVASTFM